MNIQLASLKLSNFKGIKKLEIKFHQNTFIKGKNATGKTTIADAFKWLLFDKDSTDRKDFEIKPLDKDNKPLHGLETSVTGVFIIGGNLKTIQKIFREKWTKKRGESDKVFTGNETLYYINEVPLTQTEFKKEISTFADETLFKLLTDPFYFSQNLAWQDRRNILLSLDKDITDEYVINANSELELLRELFAQESSIEKIMSMLAARKKNYNVDISNIPARIDECSNSIKYLDFVYDDLKIQLEKGLIELTFIDKEIMNFVQEDPERKEKENQIRELDKKIFERKIILENEFNKYVSDLKIESTKKEFLCDGYYRTIEAQENQIERNKIDISNLDKNLNNCRKYYEKENEKVFYVDDKQFICPTCNRLLDVENIEKQKSEMLERFNQEKATFLERNIQLGKNLVAEKQKLEDEIKELQDKSKVIRSTCDDIIYDFNELAELIANAKFNFFSEHGVLLEELEYERKNLHKELSESENTSNELIKQNLINSKKKCQEGIDEIKTLLQQENINKTMNLRIDELKNNEKNLAQKIAETENLLFLCETFIRTKVSYLEETINSKFKFVKFKLFDTQVNGGIKEVCETLVNGVPFRDANNAAKINAGIDIINTLSELNNVTAPIFIDNRESVNELIETNSQIINLVVTTDNKLKVE